MTPTQYTGGSGTKPRNVPIGVNGIAMPTAAMIRLVATSAALARLWKKGTLAVRIMWMISVWVSSDSTNQPVWNRR